MAIEPISSIMSLQAQGSVAAGTQNSTSAEKVQGFQESIGATEPVDKVTSTVENTQDKGKAGEEQGKEEQQASNDQIRKAVEKLNKSMNNSEAVFGIHDGTNRVTIKIVDKKTKEVIKELPPEKTLDMIARVWDMAGILVDEKR